MPSDQDGGCSHPTAQCTPQPVQPVRAGRWALCRTPAEGPLPGGDLAPATHGPEPTSTETPEPAGNPVSAAQTPSQNLLFRRIPGIPDSPASGRRCLVRTWECSREAAPSGLRGASPHPPWQGSPPSSKSCPNQRPQTRGPKTTAIHLLIFRRSEARSRGVGPAGSLRRLENPRGAAPQLLGARASLLVDASPQSRPVVTVAPLLPTCPRGTLGTGSGPGFSADAERTLQGSAPPGLGRDGPEAGGGATQDQLTFVSPQSLGHTAKRKKWAEVEAGREAGAGRGRSAQDRRVRWGWGHGGGREGAERPSLVRHQDLPKLPKLPGQKLSQEEGPEDQGLELPPGSPERPRDPHGTEPSTCSDLPEVGSDGRAATDARCRGQSGSEGGEVGPDPRS